MAKEITEEQLEEIGQLSDTADNLLGASELPLPPQMHIEGMRGGLTDIRNDLRRIYRAISGDDPWEHHP
jgi:hypothetical protein